MYPKELPTLTAGEEVVLVGRYTKSARGAIRVEGRVDGRPFSRRYPLTLGTGAEAGNAQGVLDGALDPFIRAYLLYAAEN